MIVDTPIRQFLTLAEELHFGRAANRLFVSQPALSASVKNLELKLGVQLLVRSSRHVELTDAGRVFVQETSRLIEQADRALAQVRSVAADYAGPIRVAYSPAVNIEWIAAFANKLRNIPDQVPNTDLVSIETVDAVRLVSAGKLDAGIVAGSVTDAELRSAVLFRETLLPAFSAGHPLAVRTAVSFDDLENEPLIWLRRDQNPELVGEIIEAFAAEHYRPRTLHEVTTFAECIQFAAVGLGITFLPERARGAAKLAGLVLVESLSKPPSLDTVLIQRRDGCSERLRRVIQLLRSVSHP